MNEEFAQARKQIESGNGPELGRLLNSHPELAGQTDDYQNSLLHHAAATGSPDLVDVCLQTGMAVDARGNTGSTPLHWAATSNHPDVCLRLIQAGARIDVSDDAGDGGTPLVQALFYGHGQLAERLAEFGVHPVNLRVAAGLGRMDLLPSFFGPDGNLLPAAGHARTWYRSNDEFPTRSTRDEPQEILDEALCYACFNARPDAVRFLLDHGANPDACPHYATALHFAVAAENRELIELLLEHGVDPTIEDHSFSSTAGGWAQWGGNQPLAELLTRAEAAVSLSAAAAAGDLPAVQARLAELDSEDVAGAAGRDALAESIQGGHAEIEQLLRQRGARLDLFRAVQLGVPDDVRAHLAGGADPNYQCQIEIPLPGLGARQRPQSVLLVAAINRHPDVCQMLLDAGAIPDAWTLAALNDTQQLLMALDCGHSIDEPDAFGRTVLHRAIQGHACDVVKLLVEAGADLEQSVDFFSFGGRALHLAAQSGAPAEILELLVRHGADLNTALNQGTPLDCARRAGMHDTASWLQERGARTADDLRQG